MACGLWLKMCKYIDLPSTSITIVIDTIEYILKGNMWKYSGCV